MNKTIGVCGAGTMGSGIAQVCAQSGFRTILFDVNTAMLDKAKTSIQKTLATLVAKGKITDFESEAILQRLIFTNEIEDCKAGIIIEAIIENPDAKADLFNSLSVINSPDTIYATNTSSLSISNIAGRIKHPAQFAGMHFFNPAPVMKLVEIVKGEGTAMEVIEELVTLAKQMGKTPVVCKDSPGFIVNRIARHYYLEALKLVEQGLAEPALIDTVLESAGFKMGPFKLMDMIGMDINYSVSNIVWEALGKPARLTPSPVQKAKVEAGNLGRKTGKGFYDY